MTQQIFSLTTTETVSGVIIDLMDPKPEQLKIHDIAWALSRLSRFGGHSLSRIPYSVGQHTVMVSRYVEEALTPGTHHHEVFTDYLNNKIHACAFEDTEGHDRWVGLLERAGDVPVDLRQMYAFHGLMHDFAEAYLQDLPTPVKRLPGVYEAYKLHENRLDALIYEAFKLPYSPTKWEVNWEFGNCVVGWADVYALLVEAYHMMPSRGLTWGIDLNRPTLSVLNDWKWPMEPTEVYELVLARYHELKPVPHPNC